MLMQYEYHLTPRQSQQLIWSRFINTHGIRGRNIPCDLHQEHLNRICKRAVGTLGSNKTEEALTRLGKTLWTLDPVLEQFDRETHVTDCNGRHCAPKAKSEKDITIVVNQLQQSKVFFNLKNRAHHTFPQPRDVLHHKAHKELHDWIIKHL